MVLEAMRRPGRGAGGARSTPPGASRPLSRRGAGWAKAGGPEQIRLFSRFVPAADAPSETRSIPSAAPAALCVSVLPKCGTGTRRGTHSVHDPWSERVHPMRGTIRPEIRKNRKEEWSNSRNPLIGRGQSLATPASRAIRTHSSASKKIGSNAFASAAYSALGMMLQACLRCRLP